MTPNPSVQVFASVLAPIVERAKARRLSLSELFQAAETLTGADAARQRAELYKAWIAFNPDNPLAHLAYFNYSVALREIGDLGGAINALQACRQIDAEFGPAHVNLGRAYEDSGDVGQAVAEWKKFADACASVTPARISHKLMALQNIGRVLETSEQFAAAEDTLRQAIELFPERREAGQHWIALRQRQCKWPVLAASEYATAKQLLAAMSPIALAAYADDPMFQLAKAYAYNKAFVGRPDGRLSGSRVAMKKVGTGKRLRIGYVSSDLREHAVGFALNEVFELHDKSSVEIFAYYCGEPRSGDPVHEHLRRRSIIGATSQVRATCTRPRQSPPTRSMC